MRYDKFNYLIIIIINRHINQLTYYCERKKILAKDKLRHGWETTDITSVYVTKYGRQLPRHFPLQLPTN